MKSIFAVVLVSTTLLTACSSNILHPSNNTGLFSGLYTTSGQVQSEREELKEKPYTILVRRFVDATIPIQGLTDYPELVWYEYNLSKLPGGQQGFVGSNLKEYFDVGPGKAENIYAEIEMTKANLTIREGNFFSTRGGRYHAAITADVMIRTADGDVLANKEMHVEKEAARRLPDGRHKPVEMDRQNAITLMQAAIRELGYKIAKVVDDTYVSPVQAEQEDTSASEMREPAL